MSKITYTAYAYLPNHYDLSDVSSGRCMPHLCNERSSYFEGEGYPLIGMADVTLELNSQDQIIQSQIDALNQQLQKERADSQVRQNLILERISKLTCLTLEEVPQ